MSSMNIVDSLRTSTVPIIYFKDLDGRFVWVNQGWKDLFQVGSEHILGKRFFGIYSEELAAGHRKNEQLVVENREERVFEEEIALGDGGHFYLTTTFPMFDNNGELTGVGAISANITEYREELANLKSSQIDLQELVIHDNMTGALNRKALQDRANQEIMRYRRYQHPFSLIMFDLDYFKEVNDRYGHAAGDRLLIRMVEVVSGLLRDTDSLYRVGGEEFVVLAPDTAIDGAMRLAERVRSAVEYTDFSPVDALTISVGVSAMVEGTDFDNLLKRADEALYRAKNEGRNRVITEWKYNVASNGLTRAP